MRLVELHRERVVLRRACARHQDGAQPAGRRLSWRGDPDGAAGAHERRALSHSCWSIPIPPCRSPLYRAADGTDIVAEWRAWGRALGLPLLVAEADGRLREPFNRIGGVGVGPPISRRRRRSA